MPEPEKQWNYPRPVESTSTTSQESAGIGAQSRSGGSGGGGKMGVDMRDYVDARTAEVRAENTLAIGKVESRVDILTTHLDSQFNALSARITTKWTTWGAALTVLGVILAALAFGGDRFDGGVQLATGSLEQLTTVKTIAQENAEQIRVLSTSMSETNQQIESLITKIEATTPQNENAQ